MNNRIKVDMSTFSKRSIVFGVVLFLFQAMPSLAQIKPHSSIKAEDLKVVLVKDIENISDSAHHHHAHDPHKSSYKILHVHFTMVSTDSTNAGYKSVMMRVIDPSGVDIYDPASGGGLFMLNGKETPYTIKETKKYDGKFLEIDFLYKHSKHFKHGLHIIELYVDGYKIGEEHFVIK
ncbi:hypothetical protein [Cytophaga aurantiaca]|uniref:hypothetical protein n=1 Tax=Cytophaga aurantiaca TaxID=29530 RepID=UPI001FDF4D0B|nr:hypothetical protein [Cytophaga aurantiaca]